MGAVRSQAPPQAISAVINTNGHSNGHGNIIQYYQTQIIYQTCNIIERMLRCRCYSNYALNFPRPLR